MASLLDTISAEVLSLEPSQVQGPSLVGLTAVRKPRPVTREDLHRRLRAIVPRRDRADHEAVGPDDQVRVSHIAYAQGRLVPRSLRFGMWLEDTHPSLPGFRERLTGARVGTSVELPLLLPDDFPPDWRGKAALFRVDVEAAREVRVPAIDDDEQIAALGRGQTLDEVVRSLGDEAVREAAQVAELDAQNQVLDQLAERLELELTDAQVDHELRRRWAASEGEALVQRGFDPAEQQEALDAFRLDPQQRKVAERSLKVTVALGLIREREGVTLTRQSVTELIEAISAVSGVKADEYRALLKSDKDLAFRFQTLALHVATVDYVMAKAQVSDAPPGLN